MTVCPKRLWNSEPKCGVTCGCGKSFRWQSFPLNSFLYLFLLRKYWGGKISANTRLFHEVVVERNIRWIRNWSKLAGGWSFTRKIGILIGNPRGCWGPPTLKWELPVGISFEKISYAPPQLVKMFKVLPMVIVMKPFLFVHLVLIENLQLARRLFKAKTHG